MSKEKSVGRMISCIHRNTHSYLHQKLETYDLGRGQLHFLMILYRNDGINQETLSEILKIDKATCARAVKKLIEHRYVTREKDPIDKRAYQLHLTKKAIELKPHLKSILNNCTRQLLTGFSKKEENQFFEYLERISNNAIHLK